MVKKMFPQSVRKYIRRAKARIRREILDIKGQENKIQELYKKLKAQYDNKRNIQISDK
ncbi:MAG: hypothetical protein Q7R53_00895 [bacterium]|nr:hypothetical protein [bacterium]